MNREEDIQTNSLWRRQKETAGFWGRVQREPPTGPIYRVIGKDHRGARLEIWAGEGQPCMSLPPADLLNQFSQYMAAKWYDSFPNDR